MFKRKKRNKSRVSKLKDKKTCTICITTRDWCGYEEYRVEMKQGEHQYSAFGIRDIQTVIDDIIEFVLNDGVMEPPICMI